MSDRVVGRTTVWVMLAVSGKVRCTEAVTATSRAGFSQKCQTPQCRINSELTRLEPNMFKNLPIIPSRTSQIFYLLFLFYSQVPPIIPFLFYCVSDIITMQDWLYTIYIVTDCFNRIFDCFNRIFDCTIRVFRSFVCFSFLLFLFYACAWPIILELFSPKL